MLRVKSMGDLNPVPTIRLMPFPASTAASSDMCPDSLSDNDLWTDEAAPERSREKDLEREPPKVCANDFR